MKKNSFNCSGMRTLLAFLLTIAGSFAVSAQGNNNYRPLAHAPWTYEQNLQIPYEQYSICAGDNAVLIATSGHPFPETLWYDAPKGGRLLHTGSAFKVSPKETTVYYAASELYTAERGRDAITVTVTPCQCRQPLDGGLGFVNVPPQAVKLDLAADTETGDLLLHGREAWQGSLLTIQDNQGRELQREILKSDRFRLFGAYTDGVYIVNVTTPEGKVLIGKVRLYQ
jgi:hypothetical protein